MKRLLILAPIGAACVWAMVVFVYRPLACNRTLNELRARTSAARETGNSYRAALLARQNLTDLRRLEDSCHTAVIVYVLEAENFDILEQKEEALAAFRRALTVDQRPELYFNIGTILVELGRMDEAVDNYVTAARLNRGTSIPSPEAEQRVRERLRQMSGTRAK